MGVTFNYNNKNIIYKNELQQHQRDNHERDADFCHFCFLFFKFNWHSLHARLNSHYEAWSYKKKKHKKITAYRKSVQKEPTVKRCLLILDLKQLRS